MSSPAAVKWTPALFPAKLSDLLSAFLLFSWIHVWGDPANENAGGHVSGLFVFLFYFIVSINLSSSPVLET